MANPGEKSDRLGKQLPSLKDLQTAEQTELLDKVDQLRAYGLNEITALPQLIVCGDQSCGKSSVLEAISGVPFPRKDTVCTRFAIELILRRAPIESMSVSIMPGQDRTGIDRERISKFQHYLMSKEDFPLLFEKAKEAMGLGDDGKSFSKDILRVEIYGPQQPQLTLVDLPGFFHAAMKGQTENDIALVNDLITSYLKNPRSIILAVVSAKSDVSNQIILRKAGEADPGGKRTMGIITKPDVLAANSESEKSYIALARNDNIVFDLGWHVVRNLDLTTEEPHEKTRDQVEASFFKSSNFSVLHSTTVGIASLRSRLSRVLFKQIRVELPSLLEEIESKIKKVKATREKLGRGHPGLTDQREFLINISQRFLVICENAVKGYYQHPFFLDGTEPERRLCANLMNKHFEFAEALQRRGALYTVEEDVRIESQEVVGPNGVGVKSAENHANDPYDKAQYRTREQAIVLACEKLKISRGRELPGLPNPFLVGELFREYSQPWEGLAREHIKDIWDATNKFLGIALEYLVGSDVADKIMGLWLYPIMKEKLAAANAKLDELLKVHKDEPMTTNHYFTHARNKMQQSKFKDELRQRLEGKLSTPSQKISKEDISQIMAMITPEVKTDMDMLAAEDAFDNMNAYYKVAMKLFMDNVPTLAIQGPIVRQVPKMFRPSDVDKMPSKLITKIAEESTEKTRLREETAIELAKLEEGAYICKQNIPRSVHNKTFNKANHKSSNTPSNKNNLSGNSTSVLLGTTPSATFSGFSNILGQPPSNSSNLQSSSSSIPYAPGSLFNTSSSSPSLFVSSNSSNSTPSGSSGIFRFPNLSSSPPSGSSGLFGSQNTSSLGSSFGTGFSTNVKSSSPQPGATFGSPKNSKAATPSLFGGFGTTQTLIEDKK